jgi:hypothetical protein
MLGFKRTDEKKVHSFCKMLFERGKYQIVFMVQSTTKKWFVKFKSIDFNHKEVFRSGRSLIMDKK